MTKMLERIEASIRQAVFETYGAMHVNGANELAKAALEALQDPTPGMVEAGLLVCPLVRKNFRWERATLNSDELTEIFKAMITAAQGEDD